MLTNVFLAAAVTLCVLIVAEIALRIVAPVPDPQAWIKSRRYVNQAIRSDFPPHHRFETEAESRLPGMAGRNVFSTNNVGLRGDSLIDPKPAGEYRVFMIGGSMVEGFYLGDDQTVTAVLQRSLARQMPQNTVRVYNAGKSGDKSTDHISMLVHRLVHFEPDLVIVMLGINDLRASLAGFDYRHFDPRPPFAPPEPPPMTLRNFLTLAATEFQLARRLYYVVKRVQPQRPQDVQERIPERSDIQARAASMRRLPVSSRRVHADTSAFRRNVETLIGVAASHCFPIVFITQAITWGTTDTLLQRWHWMRAIGDTAFAEPAMLAAIEELNQITRSVPARHGVPVFDFARIAVRSAQYFYDDMHLNVAGAQAAGEAIADFLMGQPATTRTGGRCSRAGADGRPRSGR